MPSSVYMKENDLTTPVRSCGILNGTFQTNVVCLQTLGFDLPCAQSGPVFKAVSGRTRRNSGLPNALCRPCSEVRPLVHAY